MTTTPDPLAAQRDTELMMSRRAFPVAQDAFAGPVLREVSAAAAVGWYYTDLHREIGSIALVRENGPHVDLVGEIVKVTRTMATETRVVYAYVYATAPILEEWDLALSRRAFLGLGILANEQLDCRVEVIA